jgi:hypothetical protein
MFEDQGGNVIGQPGTKGIDWFWQTAHAVYDMEIYDLISEGKVSLAFINTCLSAKVDDWEFNDTEVSLNPIPVYPGQGLIDDERARGMPFAWTHRTVADIDDENFDKTENMSSNGYGEPDLGSQCYIGFSEGSASLMQGIPYIFYGPMYYDWVGYFFYCALRWDMTINYALDHASCLLWGVDFSCYPLQNFASYWWPNWPPGEGRMEVYGNGRIHLCNPFQNMLSISAEGCSTVPAVGDYYYDPSTQEVQVSAYGYPHYYIDYWLLDGEWYSNNETTVTVQMDGNHELKSVFKLQYKLEISVIDDGNTNPSPGTHLYDPGTPVSINAYPWYFHYLDQWYVNGFPAGDDNPINGIMDDDYYVQAVFAPYMYQLSVTAASPFGPFPAPLYINGQPVGNTPYVNTLEMQFYEIYVGPVSGGYFWCYDIDGQYIYSNPYTLPLDEDHEVTALYLPNGWPPPW